MISAMSLEIYFKCLYILDHRSTHRRLRTHNLKRLFEFLLPDTQAKLREYFDPAEGQAILDHYRQHQGRWLIGLPKTFTFDFALFASSNTFEWIRYVYERRARPSEQWHGSPLVRAAQKLLLERNPSWSSMTSLGPEPTKYVLSTSPPHSIRTPPGE
jgi:hypothetical protein